MNLLDLASTCYSTSAAVLHKTSLVLHFPNKFIPKPTLSPMHKLARILQTAVIIADCPLLIPVLLSLNIKPPIDKMNNTDYLIIVAHIKWWE